MGNKPTSERVQPGSFPSIEDYLVYLRHEAAYRFALTILSREMTVLDVGCGEGYGTAMLSGKCLEITGLDTDRKTIERASTKYERSGCQFHRFNGISLPAEPGSVDVITCFQVIEHVADVPGFLAELKRVLKPGGQLLITTPNRLLRLLPGEKPWNPFHLREYDPDGLRNELLPFSPEIRLSGINANGRAREIELRRVSPGKGLMGSIKRRFPHPLKRALKKITDPLHARKTGQIDVSDFGPEDFFVDDAHPENAIDLLAICRK